LYSEARVAERITVVVRGRDGLTVEDAMRQVLETFEMMARADPTAGIAIQWCLVSASTNSPLTVVAEAKPSKPGIDATEVARVQKSRFRQSIAELRSGRVPSVWNSQEDRKRARNWLRRTHDGISETVIKTDDVDDPLVLTAQDAKVAEPILDQPPLTGKPREQIGSVEGYLVSVETHYHKPAIRIRERRTGADVLCIIPDEFRSQIAGETAIDDVWRERRVVVRGRVHYDKAGKIEKVTATKVHPIPGRNIDNASLKDPDFTSGLSAEEYLEKLRDGDGA
jgi:hypothetical protein